MNQAHQPPAPLSGMRRKAISLAGEAMVRESLLAEGQRLPLVVEPAREEVDLLQWAAAHGAWLDERLRRHGAILFRNFAAGGPAHFEEFIAVVAGRPLEYKERSSPRHRVSGNVYTSTDYPPSQSIFMHNENSYQRAWPRKLFFFCDTPAEAGGETPLADVRRVYAGIGEATRRRFAERGVMYVRNYADGLGLSWQTVFQTESRAEVERYCRQAGIDFEWKADDGLRTRQVGQAVLAHPSTGEMLWFNHAAFFHVTTLDAEIADSLLEALGEENLPNNTYYGDGSPIEPQTLDEIRAAYARETVRFAWRCGDILMIDNMLVAHGRAPYRGARRILVGMAEPFDRPAIQL